MIKRNLSTLFLAKYLFSFPKGNYDALFKPKQGKKHSFQVNSGTTFRRSAFYRRKGTNNASTFLSRQEFLDNVQITPLKASFAHRYAYEASFPTETLAHAYEVSFANAELS